MWRFPFGRHLAVGQIGGEPVVVSVGARNLYGHPDAGTLARLGAVGARVYRTDRDGAVLVETDGRTLSVTRWSDRSVERFCLDPETIC